MSPSPSAAGPVVSLLLVRMGHGGVADTDWLSSEERVRLQGITAEHRRAQFLAGHWWLRRLLADLHGGDPGTDWPLSSAADGPPRPLRPAPSLHLALSHSADLVLCGVASVPIGLDIEAPRRERDWTALSEIVCSAAERERLDAASAPARRSAFIELWSLKEAWLKRRGEGVTPGRLALLDTRPWQPGDPLRAYAWQGDGCAASLVVESGAVPQWHGIGLGAAIHWCVNETVDGASSVQTPAG